MKKLTLFSSTPGSINFLTNDPVVQIRGGVGMPVTEQGGMREPLVAAQPKDHILASVSHR